MRRLDIAVIELIPNGPDSGLWLRMMTPNMASIMPPVIATWCEQAGHRVECFVYTGFEDLMAGLDAGRDVVFISSFTRSALLAYAVSELARRRGAVTVLGGPHARCYPDDAARYVDYVLGFTDRDLVGELLRDAAPQRPLGVQLAARRQPAELPPLQQRWKFIAPTLAKTRFLKLVPMVGSLGCPYTCSFCIDSQVDYQPLPFEQLRADLRFLRTRMRRPRVAWHDPNFGVRFGDYMDAIEEAAPPGTIEHIAESSLSLLSEERLRRFRDNGFKAILPGIESWYELGDKSRTGSCVGEAKVERVAVEQHPPPPGGAGARRALVDQRRPRHHDRGHGADPAPSEDPRAPRHGPDDDALLRGREHRDPRVLSPPREAAAWSVLGVPAGGRRAPRPQRLPGQGRHGWRATARARRANRRAVTRRRGSAFAPGPAGWYS